MEGGPGTTLGRRLLGGFNESHDPLTGHDVSLHSYMKFADPELNPEKKERIMLVDPSE